MSLLLALIDSGSATVHAICVNPDGSLTYKSNADSTDNKLYLNNGEIYSRLSAIVGDKILTISFGEMVAT